MVLAADSAAVEERAGVAHVVPLVVAVADAAVSAAPDEVDFADAATVAEVDVPDLAVVDVGLGVEVFVDGEVATDVADVADDSADSNVAAHVEIVR